MHINYYLIFRQLSGTHSDHVHDPLLGRNPAIGNHCLIGWAVVLSGLDLSRYQKTDEDKKNKAMRALKQKFPHLVLNEEKH